MQNLVLFKIFVLVLFIFSGASFLKIETSENVPQITLPQGKQKFLNGINFLNVHLRKDFGGNPLEKNVEDGLASTSNLDSISSLNDTRVHKTVFNSQQNLVASDNIINKYFADSGIFDQKLNKFNKDEFIPKLIIYNFDSKNRENLFDSSFTNKNSFSVLIFTFNKGGGRFGEPCAGSLVTSEWVLTAAYCVNSSVTERALTITVYAGGNNAKEFVEKNYAFGSQVINSSEIHVHPGYRRVKHGYDVFFHDIALVKTKEKFKLTDSVSVVKLSLNPFPERWTECEVTGFGKLYKQRYNVEDYERKTYYIQVKSSCRCLEKQKWTSYNESGQLTCTWPIRDIPSSVCEGDFGAGLICEGKLKAVTSPFVFVKNPKTCGLISKPKKWECGAKNSFTIFTNTCPHMKWINKHTHLFEDNQATGKCFSNGSTSLTFTIWWIFYIFAATFVWI